MDRPTRYAGCNRPRRPCPAPRRRLGPSRGGPRSCVEVGRVSGHGASSLRDEQRRNECCGRDAELARCSDQARGPDAGDNPLGILVTTVTPGHTAQSAAYSASSAAKVDATTTVLLWLMAPTVWAMGRRSLVLVLPEAGPHPGRHRARAFVLAIVVAAVAGLAGEYARGPNTGSYLGIWRTMASYAMATFAAYPALAAMWVAGNRARSLGRSSDISTRTTISELTTVRSSSHALHRRQRRTCVVTLEDSRAEGTRTAAARPSASRGGMANTPG